jgi:hypothetical protein
MKIKIVSDGTVQGTRLFDLDKNEPLTFENCVITSVMWRADAQNVGPAARVLLGLAHVPVELVADGDMQMMPARQDGRPD